MGLYDRPIIVFSTNRHPTVEVSVSLLQGAIEQLPDRATLLLHSDQGSINSVRACRRVRHEWVRRSRCEGRGNCLDNAVMENFFGYLKEEMFHHDAFNSIEELKREIHVYFAWYSAERVSPTSTRRDALIKLFNFR